MTPKATEVRNWIRRARSIHDQLVPYEQAAKCLEDVCGTDPICRERDRLRALEAVARMEVYDALAQTVLSPRQFTILNLHYLQYESWTRIADRLQIERRYALQVHTQAIERMADQLEISGVSDSIPA